MSKGLEFISSVLMHTSDVCYKEAIADLEQKRQFILDDENLEQDKKLKKIKKIDANLASLRNQNDFFNTAHTTTQILRGK